MTTQTRPNRQCPMRWSSTGSLRQNRSFKWLEYRCRDTKRTANAESIEACFDVDELRRGRRSYKTGDQSSLVGFLVRYQVDAAGIAQVLQSPFVHSGNDLLHGPRHGLETPLSATVNGVCAFKRNHIAMPVGAFRTGRSLCPPN